MKTKFLLTLTLGTFLSGQVFADDTFQTQPLSAEEKAYFSEYYTVPAGKKLVLLEKSLLEADCPYWQKLAKAYQKQKGRSDLKQYFNFQTLRDDLSSENLAELEKMVGYQNKCIPMCIISLEDDWIYPVKSYTEADTLSKVFTSFKRKR